VAAFAKRHLPARKPTATLIAEAGDQAGLRRCHAR
jgi:hypothetical protein